jgi:2-polyprenyl-3-methyl-5-hydroxy-6-metoxy-1,4-benzoquinol methylase
MLEQRARGRELLDAPGADPRDAAASYRFMRMVNGMGASRPLKAFLGRHARETGRRNLHVLDVGAGDGSLTLRLSRWARRRGLELRFTCVDMDTAAAERAAGLLSDAENIRFIQTDVFGLEPDGYDCVTASMFLHHFPDERLPQMVEHLARLGRGPLLVNDLHRSWPTYAAAWALSRFFPPVVRHDATLSVRRGFRPQQLARTLSRIPNAHVKTGRCFPGRVWAEVRLHGDDH